jgi:tetratricopeptide (TPR) repeat protein
LKDTKFDSTIKYTPILVRVQGAFVTFDIICFYPMTKPKRPEEHITDTKAKKFLETNLPDEWYYTVPSIDYGIDYQVEIAVNHQVTGLNFSIQLKGHAKGSKGDFAKAVVKHSTLSYYKARLEPVMIVVYEAEGDAAYWTWVDDLNIDLSKGNKEYTVNVPKSSLLRDIQWKNVIDYVQTIFSNRTFISYFDISKIHNNVELAAWKVYYDNDFEQAVYLFRHLIKDGFGNFNVRQALCWSLYGTFRYHESLSLINDLLTTNITGNLLQIKACILAEFGMSDGDKGKIIQARDLFKKAISKDAPAIIYYNYANTVSALLDYKEAIRQYSVSLEIDPNFAPSWKNLGTAYGHNGEASRFETISGVIILTNNLFTIVKFLFISN